MAKILNLLLVATMTFVATSCSEPAHVPVDTLWQKEFSNAQEIAGNYIDIKKSIDGNEDLDIKNLCHMIWHSGEYIIRCKGKNDDINILPQHISTLPLDNDSVKAYIQNIDAEKFADHYFMLSAMKRGDSFDASRDGLTITVFFPGRAINDNDYDKLRQIFSSNNEILHQAYLEKMKFPFLNSGTNEKFNSIRPLIEKNVADSPLKTEILDLYDQYTHIMPGMTAPTPPLKDINGNTHTFAEFKGKVLVIDVWATWCSSCLAKMPHYMQLRDEYKDNPDIEFITVSIDRRKVTDKWKSAIAKRNMGSMLNLIPDTDEASEFECQYYVMGIPRYIVIDKNGKIVTAYAPPPSQELKEIITRTLNTSPQS